MPTVDKDMRDFVSDFKSVEGNSETVFRRTQFQLQFQLVLHLYNIPTSLLAT